MELQRFPPSHMSIDQIRDFCIRRMKPSIIVLSMDVQHGQVHTNAAHIDREPNLFEREMGCDTSDEIFPLSCHRALRLAHLIELLERDFQAYHSKATRHRWVETGKPIPARVQITFEYEAIAGKENLLRLCVHEFADQEQVDGD